MRGRTSVRTLLIGLVLGTTYLLMPAPDAGATVHVGSLSGGVNHTCGIWEDGRVRCWGLNADGQLGDGTTMPSETPADVTGLGSADLVSASQRHTCAVTAAGVARCWGANGGRLGNGETNASPTPVDVCSDQACSSPLSNAVSIDTGGLHSCAALESGTVRCWGNNEDGQLGDGSTDMSLTPVSVTGLSNVVQVSLGMSSSCALTSAGAVFCWGSNVEGQIGDDRACGMRCDLPEQVVGLDSGVEQISVAGLHACALTDAGAVFCWGLNFDGQVGDGTTGGIRIVPQQVVGLESGAASISAGGGFRGHACALMDDETLRCWGDNAVGQVGDGTMDDRNSSVPIPGLTNVVHIAAGDSHMCAVTTADEIFCWGSNTNGQFGDGTMDGSPEPVLTGIGKIESTLNGDTNCDDVVDPIDAALLLQVSAGLLSVLPCQDAADVNSDGVIDPIDAALVLQFSAGLLNEL